MSSLSEKSAFTALIRFGNKPSVTENDVRIWVLGYIFTTIDLCDDLQDIRDAAKGLSDAMKALSYLRPTL